MGLQHLPIELLRLILNGPSSWAAVELWKCGNKELSYRLANKGITDLELRDRRLSSASRWPRCLAHFKLERLSVDRPGGVLCELDTLSSELGKLHSGLRELSLSAQGAPEAFFYEKPTPGNRLSTTSHQDEDAEEEDSYRPVLRKLGDLFPQLELLSIGDDSNFSTSITYLCLSTVILHSLPQSLTSLEYRSGLTVIAKDFSAVSKNLKTLRLPSNCLGTKAALEALPQESLTDVGSIRDSVLDTLVRCRLLPNLKNFPCPRILNEYEQFFKEFQSGRLNIPNLTSLSLREPRSLLWLGFLPSSCTALRIYGLGYSALTLTERDISALPRSLLTLEGLPIDWQNVQASLWPPALSELVATKGTECKPCHFHLLPRSLLKLDTELAPPDEIDSSAEHAELLEIGRNWIDIENKAWKDAKERLLTTSTSVNMDISAYFSAAESGGLYGLPLMLTKLNFLQCDATAAFNLLLPPLTTKLELNLAERFAGSNFFKLLPPSLDLCCNLKDDYNSDLETTTTDASAESLSSKLSSLLSSNLSSLHLRYRSEWHGSESLTKYIPRSVTSLTLRFTGMKSEELSYLPPNLTTLVLENGFSHLPLDAPWVNLLPRHLTYLALPEAPLIEGEHIKFLPPGLQWMHASFSNATIAHALTLPRTLRVLKLQTSAPASAECAANGFLSYLDWNALCTNYHPFWRIRESGERGLKLMLGTGTLADAAPPRPFSYLSTNSSQNNASRAPSARDIDPRTIQRLRDAN